MNENLDKSLKRIDNTLKGFSDKELKKLSDQEIERAKMEYMDFKGNFLENKCYICGSSLESFDEGRPCLHWLLKPKGFKKIHFKEVYSKFSFVQIESYLRWLANLEKPFGNINDLSQEKPENKIIQTTIKYKNLEWSFSCANTDIQGHNTRFSNFPHYHFQMRINNQPFINFGDFHIPFTKWDLLMLKIRAGESEKVSYTSGPGMGMEEVLKKENADILLNNSKSAVDDSQATLRFQSFVEADKGKLISGDAIADLIEESKKTGAPLAKLLPKLGAKTSIIISPGEAVPNLAERKSRNRKPESQ